MRANLLPSLLGLAVIAACTPSRPPPSTVAVEPSREGTADRAKPEPSSDRTRVERGSPYRLSAAERREVMRAVRARLKDPESARFGEMRAAKDSEGRITVCGYANAKNSFGGYVGMSPFSGGLYHVRNRPEFVGVLIDTSGGGLLALVCAQRGASIY